MWGKLTARTNRTQTTLNSDPKELYRFLTKPGIEVTNMMFVKDDVVRALWR